MECGISTDLYGLQKQLEFVKEKVLVNVMIRGVQTDEERKPSVEEVKCGGDIGLPYFSEYNMQTDPVPEIERESIGLDPVEEIAGMHN